MNDIKAYAGRVILLGRLGENEYTRVAFDIKNWIEQYQNATLSIAQADFADRVKQLSLAHNRAMWCVTITRADGVQIARKSFGAFPDMTPVPEPEPEEETPEE